MISPRASWPRRRLSAASSGRDAASKIAAVTVYQGQALITREIDVYRDLIPYQDREREQERGRDQLQLISENWSAVVEYVEAL